MFWALAVDDLVHPRPVVAAAFDGEPVVHHLRLLAVTPKDDASVDDLGDGVIAVAGGHEEAPLRVRPHVKSFEIWGGALAYFCHVHPSRVNHTRSSGPQLGPVNGEQARSINLGEYIDPRSVDHALEEDSREVALA
jgi:hypothetical protein